MTPKRFRLRSTDGPLPLLILNSSLAWAYRYVGRPTMMARA